MKTQYNQEDIANFHNKDKRISFLSVLSSLCRREKSPEIFTDKLVEKAFEINEELYKKYPFIGKTGDISTLTQRTQGMGNLSPTSDYKCEFCHATLVPTKSGDAFRCPNWKKNGSGCKGTYINPSEEKRAMAEDSLQAEANSIPIIDENGYRQ